jgi:uncharacterized protein (DUF2062 family)
LVLFGAATAAASILIAQNAQTVVEVHVLGHAWTGQLYGVLVAGIVIGVVAALGIAAINRAGARIRWARRERGLFAAENERIADARDGIGRARRPARPGESGPAPG